MPPSADDGSDPMRVLGPYLGGLVGLMAVMALVFAGVGQLRSGGDAATVAAPDTGAASSTATQPEDGTGGAGTPTAGSTDGGAAAGGATGDAATDDEPRGEASPEPTGSEPSEPGQQEPAPEETLPPSQITVQVLDAADDDGSAASDVAATLEGDGYRIVAQHPAVRTYEQTTVFFTPGNQAAARQVAAQYGFPVVRPMPDNLEPTVTVHIVVGADRR